MTAYEFAQKELGIKEIKNGDNPRIVEYHSTTTLHATNDETPWCSAFVNWCLKQAGQKGTGSAAARSFLTWGTAVPTPEAQEGDIVIMSRTSDPTRGHVGFFSGWDGEEGFKLLGGNQLDSVCVLSFARDRILSVRRQTT